MNPQIRTRVIRAGIAIVTLAAAAVVANAVLFRYTATDPAPKQSGAPSHAVAPLPVAAAAPASPAVTRGPTKPTATKVAERRRVQAWGVLCQTVMSANEFVYVN